MHFCMDEVRLVVAAFSDPVMLFTSIVGWFRALRHKLHRHRHPFKDPGYEVLGYETIEAPKPVDEVLRRPKLPPTIWEPGNIIYSADDCHNGDCAMCRDVMDLADFVKDDLPLRA